MKRIFSRIENCGIVSKVVCTKGSILIDTVDVPLVEPYRWHVDSLGYATCDKTLKRMHQVILGERKGYQIDHINGNGLDNRRANLRFVTKSRNMLNLRRKNRGAYYVKRLGKWIGKVKIDGREYVRGYFLTREEALQARRELELEHLGTIYSQ